MTTPGTRLTEYLASLTERDLTAELTQYAAITLLDNVACGLYGARQPWSRMMIDFVKSQRSRGRATLYGDAEPMAPVHAALANGTSTHSFELDDVFLGALSHPGAAVVPAALAVAETEGASGALLLLALVAGYETMWRVARALNTAHNHRGFHTTSIAGPIAATVAAGVVMGFDTKQLNSAIGLAASCASGIKAFTQGTGGMVKRMHPGRSAEAGVLACELAKRGFSGPQQGIDGRYGLLEVFEGETARPQLLDEALGNSFAITHVHVKVWPCCSLLHSAVQALETIKRQHTLSPAQITSIRIGTSGRVIAQNGDPDPRETMAAQYSLPFCLAVAAHEGAAALLPLSPRLLGRPDLVKFAGRVEIQADPVLEALFPARTPARVVIETEHGKFEKQIDFPLGDPDNPMDASRLREKFHRLTEERWPPDRREQVLKAVETLEEKGFSQLTALLNQPHP